MRTSIAGALALIACAAPVRAADYVQGFESDASGWDVFGGAFDAVRVSSGTHGIASATGAFHAEVTTAAGNWGGYGNVPGCASSGCAAASFPPDGYRTSLRIFLDPSAGAANGTRFDFSSAVCDPSGAHRRDFVFNAGFFDDADGSPGSGTPRFVVSASTNSQPTSAFAKNPANSPIALGATGWHTFEHAFQDDGSGVLECVLSIRDPSDALVGTWTLSDPTDVLDMTVGGNRYGWFDFDEFAFLAIDDSRLLLTPPSCLTVADLAGCEMLAASLQRPEDDAFAGYVVAHHNAGTTPATADASNVAYLEVHAAQLDASTFVDVPADHAFTAVVSLPTSDGSNLPPMLTTLDAMAADFGEPAFGGQPAAWTIDLYDGTNSPGDLAGTRLHTLLFGTTVCDVEQTWPTPETQILRLVLASADGLLHTSDAPEIDLTTAKAWDGAAFTVDIPGLSPVEPFLSTTSRLVSHGTASDPELLTGSADPGFVTLWGTAACERDTLAFVAHDRLALTIVDPQACYAPGDLLTVQLEMGCLDQDVTGFFASLSYDPSVLALQPSDTGSPPSSYTSVPFPLHIGATIDDVGGGTLLLDGSVGFTDPGTNADALLATLFFVVLPGSDGVASAITFTPGGVFPSELSYEGVPLVTRLSEPLGFVIDETAPDLVCAPDVDLAADPGQCSAQIVLAPPMASDGCGVLSVVGTRDDTLSLDDPYPAGCAPGDETLVTWTVTDCAGHAVSCVQSVRVSDAEAPTLVGTPGDVTVVAQTAACTAVVTYAAPTAVDACDPGPVVSCVPPSGSVFAAGVTTVVCTAVDACGNMSMSSFDVEVVAVDDVYVTIDLVGVTLPVTRCIRFVDEACVVVAELPLPFTDHDGDDANSNGYVDATEGSTNALATPVRFSGLIPVTCSDTDTLCVKDVQHTMWDTTTLTRVGSTWVADSNLALRGGDTDFDGDVDISDVAYFFFKFGGHQRVGGCPFTGFPRDADFSNNDGVGIEDYAFLVANYTLTSSCACTALTAVPLPVNGFALLTSSLDAALQPLVDLDGDGWFDARDVRALEQRHGLPQSLSERMQELEHRR